MPFLREWQPHAHTTTNLRDASTKKLKIYSTNPCALWPPPPQLSGGVCFLSSPAVGEEEMVATLNMPGVMNTDGRRRLPLKGHRLHLPICRATEKDASSAHLWSPYFTRPTIHSGT